MGSSGTLRVDSDESRLHVQSSRVGVLSQRGRPHLLPRNGCLWSPTLHIGRHWSRPSVRHQVKRHKLSTPVQEESVDTRATSISCQGVGHSGHTPLSPFVYTEEEGPWHEVDETTEVHSLGQGKSSHRFTGNRSPALRKRDRGVSRVGREPLLSSRQEDDDTQVSLTSGRVTHKGRSEGPG